MEQQLADRARERQISKLIEHHQVEPRELSRQDPALADPGLLFETCHHDIDGLPRNALAQTMVDRPDAPKSRTVGWEFSVPRIVRRGPASEKLIKQRNNDIVAAAKHEFLSKGFRGAKITQIAKNSRVSNSTIYSIFGSKEELFRTVAIASVPMSRTLYIGALDYEKPLEVVIGDIVDLFIESRNDRQAIALMQLAIAERDNFPILAEMELQATIQLVTPLGEYLRAKAKPGALSEREALLCAFQLLQMSVGGYATVLTGPEVNIEASEWRNLVVRLFLRGFPAA